MLGSNLLDVSLHGATPAARHVSPLARRGAALPIQRFRCSSGPVTCACCCCRRAKGVLMAEDVPKLEKLLKKGMNVTPQVIADRQVKVGSQFDGQAGHAAH